MTTLQLHTTIDIPAPVEQVWKVLMDWKSYPDWNPFISQLMGQPNVGAQLSARIAGMSFRPIVTALEPHKHFGWSGKLWFKGLFDGAHQFRLEPLPNGYTRLHHSESFSGLLVPIFKGQLLGKTQKGFEAMNQALKAQVEMRMATF